MFDWIGYGASGRLGIGGNDSVMVPTLLESIHRVFIKKVAVNSGGKHCLALGSEGQVYSWGEGDDGKLGHGDRESYDQPKLIEALLGTEIVDIACGGHHSAAISRNGALYTWGKGIRITKFVTFVYTNDFQFFLLLKLH